MLRCIASARMRKLDSKASLGTPLPLSWDAPGKAGEVRKNVEVILCSMSKSHECAAKQRGEEAKIITLHLSHASWMPACNKLLFQSMRKRDWAQRVWEFKSGIDRLSPPWVRKASETLTFKSFYFPPFKKKITNPLLFLWAPKSCKSEIFLKK